MFLNLRIAHQGDHLGAWEGVVWFRPRPLILGGIREPVKSSFAVAVALARGQPSSCPFTPPAGYAVFLRRSVVSEPCVLPIWFSVFPPLVPFSPFSTPSPLLPLPLFFAPFPPAPSRARPWPGPSPAWSGRSWDRRGDDLGRRIQNQGKGAGSKTRRPGSKTGNHNLDPNLGS